MSANVEVLAPPVREQACRLCGVARSKGEPDEAWTQDVAIDYERREVRQRRDADGVLRFEADERPWTRRHVACWPTAQAVLHDVLDVMLSEEDARVVLDRHGRSLLAGDRLTTVRRPWGHLTKVELERLRQVVDAVRPDPEPTLCDQGRCGVCGASRSTAWTLLPGLAWSDGRPAPLCANCEQFAPYPGGAIDRDLLTIRALGTLVGARPTPSLRAHQYFGFRLAADVLGTEERLLDGSAPWTYRPAGLEAARAAVRAALPELLIDQLQRALGMKLLSARRIRASAETARLEAVATPGAAPAAWT